MTHHRSIAATAAAGTTFTARRTVAAMGCMLLLTAGASAHAAVCRVSSTGTDAGDGRTWAAATLLQSALAKPACSEIWIQQGTYKPTEGADRSIAFAINRPVKLYGGFAGTETALAQRSADSRLTVLSGDIGTPVVSADNSHHVVVIGGLGAGARAASVAGIYQPADTVIDGLSIVHGRADGASHASGGGLYCNGAGQGSVCSPSIANVSFRGNWARDDGGAVYSLGAAGGASSPGITQSTFIGNAVDGYGGAIASVGQGGTSSPAIAQSTFIGNASGRYGGAIASHGNAGTSSPRITQSTFSSNWAGDFGGALASVSSGSSGVSRPLLSQSTLIGNASDGYGGALSSLNFAGGGGQVEVVSSVIWGNTSVHGVQLDTTYSGKTSVQASILQGGCAAGPDCVGVINADPTPGSTLAGYGNSGGNGNQALLLLPRAQASLP
ncbi:hypothetical protein [Acidovorax sp. Root219]|uniref:hypothetical protein n=1 Tax=Acidovorax sp. Root219 TaxID=1736493 RepID=UPI000708EA0E|nr:hypothetical protein [Acidovorax sp. Root219]